MLRGVQQSDETAYRLEKVSQGVPNYFGPQRFGINDGNLHLGLRMLQGETIRNRQKRSMAISALRAWLFNQTLSERITQGHFDKILPGDIMLLSGSNSYFVPSRWMRIPTADYTAGIFYSLHLYGGRGCQIAKPKHWNLNNRSLRTMSPSAAGWIHWG